MSQLRHLAHTSPLSVAIIFLLEFKIIFKLLYYTHFACIFRYQINAELLSVSFLRNRIRLSVQYRTSDGFGIDVMR